MGLRAKGLFGPASLLGHHDPLGLLDHRHGGHLHLQPGERRVLQDVPPRAAPADLVRAVRAWSLPCSDRRTSASDSRRTASKYPLGQRSLMQCSWPLPWRSGS